MSGKVRSGSRWLGAACNSDITLALILALLYKFIDIPAALFRIICKGKLFSVNLLQGSLTHPITEFNRHCRRSQWGRKHESSWV